MAFKPTSNKLTSSLSSRIFHNEMANRLDFCRPFVSGLRSSPRRD